MSDSAEHWSKTAIAALQLAVKWYRANPQDVPPSWFIIAQQAIAAHDKAKEPLPEHQQWEYANR